MPVSTGKLFIWLLVLTHEAHAAISCGEKANISDVVSLALWPLSLIPQGCICMRTDRGRRFPPPLWWKTTSASFDHQGKNTSRSNVGVTVWSRCQFQSCPTPAHFLTAINASSTPATVETCLFIYCFKPWETSLWISRIRSAPLQRW